MDNYRLLVLHFDRCGMTRIYNPLLFIIVVPVIMKISVYNKFNDDLSGVTVILAIFNWLSKQNTNYTYKVPIKSVPSKVLTVEYIPRCNNL